MEAAGSNSAGRRVLVVLGRLLLVLVIGAAIGAGAYFGLPLAYRGLVEPVRLNAERIGDLEAELERARAELAALEQRSSQRTAELETSSLQIRESFAELQAGLEVDLTALERQLDRLEGRMQELGEAQDSQAASLEAAMQEATQPDAGLLRDLAVTRALLHLMRARLWLIENNLGLAAEQVEAARAELDGIEGAELAAARLDQALAELGATPLVAAEDLEIAWMLLTVEQSE